MKCGGHVDFPEATENLIPISLHSSFEFCFELREMGMSLF